MGFQKIDKKQMPQVIGLGVVSCGMFGYFAIKMMAPTASAAPPPPAKKADGAAAAKMPAASPAAGLSAASGTATLVALPDAPPPTPGMRDPFVPAISDITAPAPAVVRTASRITAAPGSLHIPAAPPLPSPGPSGDRVLTALPFGGAHPRDTSYGQPTGGLATMPVVLTAPTWTVTGVVRSGTENMVILRNGDERRMVRAGEMVDGHFRLVDVTRDYAVLRHGVQSFTLPLGGPKVAPAAKVKRTPQGTGFRAEPGTAAEVLPTAGTAVPGAQAAVPAPQAPGPAAQELASAAQAPQILRDAAQKSEDTTQSPVATADGRPQDPSNTTRLSEARP